MLQDNSAKAITLEKPLLKVGEGHEDRSVSKYKLNICLDFFICALYTRSISFGFFHLIIYCHYSLTPDGGNTIKQPAKELRAQNHNRLGLDLVAGYQKANPLGGCSVENTIIQYIIFIKKIVGPTEQGDFVNSGNYIK